ncbi:MAG: diguanylate cyclase [Pseudomonas sp.]|nr:diguanylate cyclase [Pseudomonas sp.]
MIEGHCINTYISVGISLFPAGGVSIEQFLAQADSAMYQAKKNGGNACHFSLLHASAG